ncbi:MAG: hypothetical protein QOE97_3268 [Pseudonocardiales bacterium]|nr:hypothetical protein [Pseudonocardiales bacterium]
MSEALEGDLFGRVAAALQQIPRQIRVDAELEKVVVTSAVPDGRSTLALAIGSTQSVMFYSVWPDPVPQEQVGRCVDYVTRANTGLSTAVFELDQDSGILAVRSGIHFSDVALIDELPESAFVRLLWLALLDVEQLAAQHLDGIAAVRSGASAPDALQVTSG